MQKTRLLHVLFLSGFWTCSTAFIVLFEGAWLGFPETLDGIPYRFNQFFLLSVILSAMLNTAAALFEVYCFSKIMRKRPFGLTLLLKTFFYLSLITVFHTTTALLLYSRNLQVPLFDHLVMDLFVLQHIQGARLFMSIAYYGLVVIIALFVVQVSEKFGQGVMIDFIIGKYHQPKQAKRIFMFMDLKSSTAYAERLGHIRYSQLIQECFYDLTDVVARYNARIYQYVGDEVVLTWEIEHGLHNANCLCTYFAYDEKIRNNHQRYEKQFGLIPEFKASLHLGEVTVAEVGELKKELAYHGDVIITASRIQEKCNAYNAKMLVSEQLKNAVGPSDLFQFDGVGNILLKGKRKSVSLYKVTANPCPP